MRCAWRSRWRLLAMGLAAATIGTGCGATAPHTTSSQPSSPGEPESAAEVASELHEFQRQRVSAAACHQTSAGHWTCAVSLADGSTGTVVAVWYGRARSLGLSLVSVQRNAR